MPDAYDRITLLCRLKTAQTRNKEQESGERYVRLKELHQKECRDMDLESWNCRKKRRMPIRKRYVSVITGSRYWKICFWSLKNAEENETGAPGDGKALYFAREKKGMKG